MHKKSSEKGRREERGERERGNGRERGRRGEKTEGGGRKQEEAENKGQSKRLLNRQLSGFFFFPLLSSLPALLPGSLNPVLPFFFPFVEFSVFTFVFVLNFVKFSI